MGIFGLLTIAMLAGFSYYGLKCGGLFKAEPEPQSQISWKVFLHHRILKWQWQLVSGTFIRVFTCQKPLIVF